jgi:hypothetical protein
MVLDIRKSVGPITQLLWHRLLATGQFATLSSSRQPSYTIRDQPYGDCRSKLYRSAVGLLAFGFSDARAIPRNAAAIIEILINLSHKGGVRASHGNDHRSYFVRSPDMNGHLVLAYPLSTPVRPEHHTNQSLARLVTPTSRNSVHLRICRVFEAYCVSLEVRCNDQNWFERYKHDQCAQFHTVDTESVLRRFTSSSRAMQQDSESWPDEKTPSLSESEFGEVVYGGIYRFVLSKGCFAGLFTYYLL